MKQLKKSIEDALFSPATHTAIVEPVSATHVWASNGHLAVKLPLAVISSERRMIISTIPQGKCLVIRETESVIKDGRMHECLPREVGCEVTETRVCFNEAGSKQFNRKLNGGAVVMYLNDQYLRLIKSALSASAQCYSTITATDNFTAVTFRNPDGEIVAVCMPVREAGNE